MGVVFDHRVEDHDELSHAGGEDGLAGFSARLESLSEGHQDWVMLFCGECGHVERATKCFASAADAAFTFGMPAIVVEGGDTDQGGDLLTIEFSQFRQFGDDGGSGDSADAGDSFEEFEAILPLVVGEDELEDGLVEPLDIFAKCVEGPLQALSDGFVEIAGETVGFRSVELHELSSAGDELVEFGLFLMGLDEWTRLHVQCETGNDLGVNAIGFGKDAESFGEVTDLARVDDRDGVSCGGEFGHERLLVLSGGFEDNATGPRRRQ